MRRGTTRSDEDAAGRLLERSGDCTPRGMIIHHVRVMTKPGLQAGAHRHLRLRITRMLFDRRMPPFLDVLRLRLWRAVGVGTALLIPHAIVAQSTNADARYRVTSTAVLSLDRAPDTPLVDTVVTTSRIGIALSGALDTIATLSVDSLELTSTGMIRRATDAFTSGISVSAIVENGRPRLTGDSATACATERPMAGLLPELLPLLPMPLRAEQQWSDTLTVTTCRSGLPVTMVTIANYRTLTGMDSTTVLLERRALLRATGSAMIRDQLVTLAGVGTAESVGVVQVAARRLQTLRATQSLEFELTNGQQTRRMLQQITDTAALLP